MQKTKGDGTDASGGDAMDLESAPASPSVSAKTEAATKTEDKMELEKEGEKEGEKKEGEKEAKPKEEKKPEPEFEILENPVRSPSLPLCLLAPFPPPLGAVPSSCLLARVFCRSVGEPFMFSSSSSHPHPRRASLASS